MPEVGEKGRVVFCDDNFEACLHLSVMLEYFQKLSPCPFSLHLSAQTFEFAVCADVPFSQQVRQQMWPCCQGDSVLHGLDCGCIVLYIDNVVATDCLKTRVDQSPDCHISNL